MHSWQIPGIGKAYLALVTIESLCLTTIAVIILATKASVDEPDSRAVNFYSVTAIYVTACQVYFSFASIFKENVFQFIASIISSSFVWLWALYHLFSTSLHLTRLFNHQGLALVILTSTFQLIFMIMSPFIYKSFGWRMYEEISAEAHIQRMYLKYQAYLSFMKVDVQLGILLLMMAAFFLFHCALDVVLNASAVIVTIAWAYLGYFAIRFERSTLLKIFAAFSIVEPGYIAGYLFAVFRNPNRVKGVSFPQFAIVGSLAVVCRILLMICVKFVFDDFNKGLKRFKLKTDLKTPKPDGADHELNLRVSRTSLSLPCASIDDELRKVSRGVI
eukprot:482591_1